MILKTRVLAEKNEKDGKKIRYITQLFEEF
jgi:hypothetical protein